MSYLAADVEKITGIKRNRLEQWMKSGFISPSIQVAKGYGTRNVWSLNDLYEIELFKQVTESGLSRDLVSKFLDSGRINENDVGDIYFLVYMRKNGEVKSLALAYDKNEDKTINLSTMQKELDVIGFDDCYIVNFKKIIGRVDQKIEKFKKGEN